MSKLILNPEEYGFIKFPMSGEGRNLYFKVSDKININNSHLMIITDGVKYHMGKHNFISFDNSGNTPTAYANTVTKTYYDGTIPNNEFKQNLLMCLPGTISKLFSETKKHDENNFFIKNKFLELTSSIYIKQVKKSWIAVIDNGNGYTIKTIKSIELCKQEDLQLFLEIKGDEHFNGTIPNINPDFLFDILKHVGLV